MIDPSESNPRSDLTRPAFWLVALAVASLARLAVAASHPLFETEAYYWLWSRRPDWGYFDHPPMLAWIVGLTDFFGPPHSLAARMHAVLSHFACSLLLYCLGRNAFGSTAVGVRAALLYNLIPVFSLGAIQNQPDVPLLLFWLATLVAFERALTTRRPAWWIAAGVAAGGALLSKLHGFLFLGSLFLLLLTSRRGRAALATPWPWLALAAALALFAPNIIWNAESDWMSYRFQFLRHAEDGWRFDPRYPIETLFAPLLYLSPWVYGAMLLAGWRAWRRGVVEGRPEWAIGFWAWAPLFFFFFAFGWIAEVRVHWPVAAFVGLCPALAAMLDAWPRCRRVGLYVSAGALSLAVYAGLLHPRAYSRALPGAWLTERLPLQPEQFLHEDYASRSFGWTELGEALRSEVERSAATAPTFIAARRFDRAAMAAFYAERPELAHVFDPGPDYRRRSREPDPRAFLAWEQPLARPGANAIYVLEERKPSRTDPELEDLRRRFERVGEPIVIEVEHRGFVWRRWLLLRCEGLKDEG